MHRQINQLLNKLKRECPECYAMAEARAVEAIAGAMKHHAGHVARYKTK